MIKTSLTVKKYGNPFESILVGSQKGNLKVATSIVSNAKALAPVDKGEFRGSIHWKSYDKEGPREEGPELEFKPDENQHVVGSGVAHARPLEEGTKHMAAQPTFEPAARLAIGENPLSVLASLNNAELAKDKGKVKIERVKK